MEFKYEAGDTVKIDSRGMYHGFTAEILNRASCLDIPVYLIRIIGYDKRFNEDNLIIAEDFLELIDAEVEDEVLEDTKDAEDYWIYGGSDYHTKSTMHSFHNRMKQLKECASFEKGKFKVTLTDGVVYHFVSTDNLIGKEEKYMIDKEWFKRWQKDYKQVDGQTFTDWMKQCIETEHYIQKKPLQQYYYYAIKVNKTGEVIGTYPVIAVCQLDAKRKFKKKYRELYPMETFNYKFRHVKSIDKVDAPIEEPTPGEVIEVNERMRAQGFIKPPKPPKPHGPKPRPEKKKAIIVADPVRPTKKQVSDVTNNLKSAERRSGRTPVISAQVPQRRSVGRITRIKPDEEV